MAELEAVGVDVCSECGPDFGPARGSVRLIPDHTQPETVVPQEEPPKQVEIRIS